MLGYFLRVLVLMKSTVERLANPVLFRLSRTKHYRLLTEDFDVAEKQRKMVRKINHWFKLTGFLAGRETRTRC